MAEHHGRDSNSWSGITFRKLHETGESTASVFQRKEGWIPYKVNVTLLMEACTLTTVTLWLQPSADFNSFVPLL